MEASTRELWAKRAAKIEQIFLTFIMIAVCALTLIAFAGCAPIGYVKSSEVAPLYERIRMRHDAYVDGDLAKDKAQKELEKTSSALLSAIFAESQKNATASADTTRATDPPKDPPAERWVVEGEGK